MIFNNYLNKVFGTKVKVKILRFLFQYPDRGFTSRELSKFINCSHTSISNSLRDIAGMNLIRGFERIGTANYFKINKMSILFNNLKKVFVYEKELLKRNKNLGMYLGSSVKIKILRTISANPDKTYTSRALAKDSNCSHVQVLRTLGNPYMYNPPDKLKLATDKFLYKKILKDIFYFEKNILNKLKNNIVDFGEKVSSIILFGSIARGKETFKSDIDLLIITENKKEIKEIINEKQRYITESCGNVISPYIMDRKEYHKKKDTPFMQELKKQENYKVWWGEKII
ncbi:nucleotidyltransferase domain-containing protein [Candidatus Woesearchaeota archaeon]|nr:nucleotidyltransferase domain-containing protein [Candidatus Woesearchaeota archaeon]